MGIVSKICGLFVHKRRVCVTYHDASFVYDGIAHELPFTVDGLPDGLSLQLVAPRSWTDATSGPVEVPSPGYRILNKSGKDVSKRFVVDEALASMEISRAPLVVKSGSAAKVWDGEPLMCPEVHITGLIAGEVLVARAAGRVIDEGSAPNDIVIDWAASNARKDNYDLQLVPGALEVTGAVLTGVETNPVTVTYDGKVHGFDVCVPEGARIDYMTAAVYRDAGTYQVEYAVTMPNHIPVRGTAQLTIVKRPLKVAACFMSKVYDGEPLTCDMATVNGLATDEHLSLVLSGSITDVGTVTNAVSIDWSESSARRDNYEVELINGTLTVEPAELEVWPVPVELVYDGAYHEFDVCADDGATIEFLGESRFADAGEHRASFKVSKPNYETYFGEAVLTILPRPLVVTAPSARKVWDGKPLECPEVRMEGLVPGESLAAHATGVLTEEGSIANPVQVDWAESTAKEGNYDLELRSGTLSIEPMEFDIPCALSGEVVYDGEPHFPVIDVPEGATLSFDEAGGFVDVGSYLVDYAISAPHHTTRRGTYALAIIDSPEPVAVVTTGGTFKYDGKDHGATVEVSGLPRGYVLREAKSNACARNVADSPVVATCDVLRIEDMSGRDATNKLNLVYSNSMIAIAPRTVSIRTFDARKRDDGKPLTSKEVRLDGLVEGETATAVVTGEQIGVGQSVNAAELVFNGTARPDNYRVVKSFGKLTVEESTEPKKPSLAGRPRATDATPAFDQVFPKSWVRIDEKEPPHVPGTPVIGNGESLVAWRKPVVRESGPVGNGRASRERRRHFVMTPVAERPDLEEMGLGSGFRPYPGQDMKRFIGDTDLRRAVEWAEERAKAAIDEVQDQYADALLFQTFSPLGRDLASICAAVEGIFNYRGFRADKRYALAYIHDNCRNAFLVFVACLARKHSDAYGVWKEVFKVIDLGNTLNEGMFKRMFASYLYQRKMPVFESNEAQYYLAKTAFLHGGFSHDVWKGLWEHALVPMAKGKKLQPDASGELVLNHVMDLLPESKVSERRIKELLEMAPVQATTALLETAWKVACQAVSAESRASIIANLGLSELAMSALVEVLGSRKSTATGHGLPKVMFLNQVRLTLDSQGVVHVSWSDSDLPSSMAGCRVDYLINGKLVRSCDVVRMTTHACLAAGTIEVAPCTRYDVEARLMVPAREDEGKFVEASSMFQRFQNAKPGCYEFIRTPQGEYRFREPDERITKRRRVAYLVPDGVRVMGTQGMELLNTMDCMGAWGAMQVYEFNVMPGAAGVLVDEATDEILTAWREDYRVSVDKSKVIGRVGNIDLYGHVMGAGQTDVALPSIKIKAPEGASMDDIEVRFVRDGHEGELESRWVVGEDGGLDELELAFPSSQQGAGIAKLCVIEARQGGNRLLRYRFAIVPIQGFRLEDCKIIGHELYGVYGFTATEEVQVAQIEGSAVHQPDKLAMGEDAFIETLLEAETARVQFTLPTGDSVEADLLLAGIKVEADPRLFEVAETSSINLATLQDLGASQGIVKISTASPRGGRAVQVRLGKDVVMNKMLDKASDTTFNLANTALLVPAAGKVYEPAPLRILIHFGFKAEGGKLTRSIVVYDFLRCSKGLGFKKCGVRFGADGREMLCFDADTQSKTLAHDLHVTFTNGSDCDLVVYEECDISAGQRHIPLSQEIREVYRAKSRRLYATITTVSPFGIPDSDNEITVSLRARKDKR